MKILVHDRSGHPFQVQLSRELARQGHRVLHSWGSFFQGPKGALARRPEDPPGLLLEGIELGQAFRKYSPRRFLQERRYAAKLLRQVRAFGPEAILLGNMPPDALSALLRHRDEIPARWTIWVQDLYGAAIESILGPRIPVFGRWIGRLYGRLEARALSRADAVVLISEDFAPALAGIGLGRDAVTVIPNWATIEDLPVRPRGNAWARAHDLAEGFNFLYSGTLGLKHDPAILLELARDLGENGPPGARVVVVSEGLGADEIRSRARDEALASIRVLPFVAIDELADALGAADVLLAVLEENAGIYSVPSKVLTYLCAERPLLLAVPEANRAARMVRDLGGGLTVAPADRVGFLEAAHRLLQDRELRRRCGRRARAYAERSFEIESIGRRFLEVLDPAATT